MEGMEAEGREYPSIGDRKPEETRVQPCSELTSKGIRVPTTLKVICAAMAGMRLPVCSRKYPAMNPNAVVDMSIAISIGVGTMPRRHK